MRRWPSWIPGLLLALVIAELFSAVSLVYLERSRELAYRPADRISEGHARSIGGLLKGKHRYTEHSPVLGWRVRDHGSSTLYNANSAGIRGAREYEKEAPPGTLRIAAFGDSFTHGDDVADDECWPAFMESAGDGWEVLNFGVPGYGLDQAYLRYLEEGMHYAPNIVLIGYMAENIGRHLSRYRPFYRPLTGVPLGKPRFRLEGDDLVLLPNPLARLEDYRPLLESPGEVLPVLGEGDGYFPDRYFSHPFEISRTFRLLRVAEGVWRKWRRSGGGEEAYYRETGEHLPLTLRIFDEFYRAVVENGSKPLILVLPEKLDFRSRQTDEKVRYVPLLDHFARQGYRHLDLMETLLECEETFGDGGKSGHYSAEANRRIARRIREEILRMDTGDPGT